MVNFLSVPIQCPYDIFVKTNIELMYVDDAPPKTAGCMEFQGTQKCASCIEALQKQFPVYPGVKKWHETVTPDV